MVWIGNQNFLQLLCSIVAFVWGRQPTEGGYVMTIGESTAVDH
jgi:hypothetical protein